MNQRDPLIQFASHIGVLLKETVLHAGACGLWGVGSLGRTGAFSCHDCTSCSVLSAFGGKADITTVVVASSSCRYPLIASRSSLRRRTAHRLGNASERNQAGGLFAACLFFVCSAWLIPS